MPHGDDIRLAGTAADRAHGKVDLVGSRVEGRDVLLDADAGGVVAVEDDVHVLAQELAGPLDGLMDVGRGGGAAGVLEADGVVLDAGVEDLAQRGFVEVRVVGAGGPRRQAHHGDDHLVAQSCIDDGLAAVDEVVDVVEGVEVTDGGDPVLLEELCVEVDDVPRLAVQADDVHTPGEGLQVGVRPGDLAELIHHVEGVFIGIEVEGLEACSTARLEVVDARLTGGGHCRHEVFGEDTSPIDGLKAIAEGGYHKFYGFFHLEISCGNYLFFRFCECHCDGCRNLCIGGGGGDEPRSGRALGSRGNLLGQGTGALGEKDQQDEENKDRGEAEDHEDDPTLELVYQLIFRNLC